MGNHQSKDYGKSKRSYKLQRNLNTVSTDLLNSDASILELGFGYSYRTKYIQNLWSKTSVFETVHASVNYVTMFLSHSIVIASRPGFTAGFGVHNRISKGIHFGLKLSYHLASVKRAALADEKSSARSLYLTGFLVALILPFIFSPA